MEATIMRPNTSAHASNIGYVVIVQFIYILA